MLPVVLALVPVAALIALGHALRARGGFGEAFWAGAERLSYAVLLPALFVHGLATARLGAVPAGRLMLALVLGLLATAAALVLLRPRLGLDGPGFTSVFQGGVRFNNYVAVSAAAGLYGGEGVALAAFASAAVVPTVNLLCVLVFARCGTARPSARGVLRALALNPLILGCAIGGVLQATGLGLPGPAEPFVRALGQASLPLGLLCVGAAFEPRGLGGSARAVGIASAAKFVALPLAVALACRTLGVGGPAAGVAVLVAVMPTAASSYVLARQLGGDAPLMARIVAAQTILAAAAVPLVGGLALGLAGAGAP